MTNQKQKVSDILNKEWFVAAGIRAIKTAAQTALGMFVVGMALSDINWVHVVSCAVVAAIFSMLTSLKGLPEVGTDGTLVVDMSESEHGVLKFNVDMDTAGLHALETKDKVRLEVAKETFE